MDIAAAVAAIPWFARQGADVRAALVAAGRPLPLAAGQWVYGEGDPDTGLCAILSGALRLEVAVGPDRDVLIGLAQAPTVLGQSRRSGGGPRIVTTRAARATTVLLIADAALERIAADRPELWRSLNELVYAQLDSMVHLAAQLLSHTPRARIATRLLQLADAEDCVTIGQADLAEMCGLTRKAVNAHLGSWAAAGHVARHYRGIRIIDRPALAAISNG